MKTSFILSVMTLLLCFFTLSTSAQTNQNKPPNVIVIMADDMGYGDPKCYNPESKIPTPNMDALSKQGIRFTDAHTAASACTPSRYALLTGRYSWRSRLKKKVSWSGYDNPLIHKEETTLADVFQKAGYTTGVVGKWHLGMNFLRKQNIDFVKPKTHHEKGRHGTRDVDFSTPIYNGPNYLGFDYAFVSGAGHNMEPFCYIENDYTVGVPTIWRKAKDTIYPGVSAVEVHEGWMVKGWDPRKVGPDLTQKAVDFITKSTKQNPGQPFFLYLPTVSPHRPCTPPDFIKGTSEAGERGDMVAEFDWTVGQIMKVLEALKINENTVLIVTSDNGAVKVSDDGKDYGHKSCGDLRGFKGGVYEGGHRVPLIMRWPAKIRGGQVNDNLVCLLDLHKTFSEMLNISYSNEGGEDSYNILPTMLKGKEVRHSLVMLSSAGHFAIRNKDWKLIFQRNEPVALFNLSDDPYEKRNLIKSRSQKIQELTKLLNSHKWQ
ncbi:sulfatase family protein [Zobellia galactanivorans]|uniref:Sulfatase, family S1-15 n=1 Tax=Zobellia galactanivorans (strain DSM 12802 / CCUG 47099 / CIP 106680 / NCIMB 13871 / Dsij) TaxID=63186 RepID=G0LA53_ZOBGA|nr:arylsulfatase [Zobellia galactanivorans]CAZ95059.1 Sulfatase, family S1-15 [Zobellia galactanivorans]